MEINQTEFLPFAFCLLPIMKVKQLKKIAHASGVIFSAFPLFVCALGDLNFPIYFVRIW
jgi:hypothetical protein